MNAIDNRLGFLPLGKDLPFSGGQFLVLQSFRETEDQLKEITNIDGFIYPPTEVTRKGRETFQDGQMLPMDQWEWPEVPKTSRPALLHKLAPSHDLVLDAPVNPDTRKNDAGFLMYLIGYLYGCRLQFHDWWFDGRIRMKKSHNISFRDETASNFLSTAYVTWKAWDPNLRRHFTNTLYMNSRCNIYEWDWERFMIAYMVFDACYKHAKSLGQVHAPTHRERFEKMCTRYGLQFNRDVCDKIVKLRNELSHEALWNSGQPCNSESQESYDLTEYLRGINHRLIPAILQFPTNYIGSDWDSRSTVGF